MKSKTVLVTGGAGYIGSHVVRQLGEAGHSVVVLDNLVTGFRQAVLHGELVIGNSGDAETLDAIFARYDIDTVMHFAAHTIVPESVAQPLKYYGNNTCASRTLLERALAAGVQQVVFSSTAAVYGIPASGTASESTPTVPINPYGSSKLMTEWMLRDLALASPLRYVALRYFNVAGSDPQARIGQSTPKATLLTKVACEAAIGKRDHVSIFGTDYATPDGTGVRDYIHVEDLAGAHLKALDYLRAGGEAVTLNCGYGHGYSVREVLRAVEEAASCKLTIKETGRRAGDPPSLVAVADKVRRVLGWTPRYDDLKEIVASSLRWERKLAAGIWAS
jgi:UDP-glucose 4-epimerase